MILTCIFNRFGVETEPWKHIDINSDPGNLLAVR